jgi:hypothetical protein
MFVTDARSTGTSYRELMKPVEFLRFLGVLLFQDE